ncbi:MAG: M20/M25/M40 family metallo-hydrolase [Candidatus Thorarchaeota archaeon]
MSDYQEIAKIVDGDLENHTSVLQMLVKQPSVSVQKLGTKECAELIANLMSKIGFSTVDVYPGSGNPIIFGKFESASHPEKTLLLYGAYDSNPAEEEKWSIPPYEARIVDHPEKGRILVGRGVNNKLKIVGILNAIDSVKKALGDIPVDIVVVFDGEEEMFSPTLPQFLKEYEQEIKIADGLYMPFASQNSHGVARVQLGYKGVLYLELTASGKAWGRGPSDFEIHSQHRPVVDNPIWRLIEALKSMVGADGNGILVEGIMDDVIQPEPAFFELIDKLGKEFDVDAYRKGLSVQQFAHGDLDSKELLKQLMFTCQINLDGIWGGYTDVGPEAVIPEIAQAKLDIRLIPNQKTEKIYELICNHLAGKGFSDIGVEKLANVETCRTSVNADIAQSLIRAYGNIGTKIQVWPTSLATIPIYLFNREPLSLPFATGCVGSGGHSHGFDEFFLVDGTDKVDGISGFVKCIASLIYEFGKS